MTREVVCQQLVELVTDYLEDALSEETRVAVETHLSRCDDCSGYVAQVRRMLELTRSTPAGPVPPALLDRLTAEFRRRSV